MLEFKGRQHPIMAPGHYTALFFLDEATAMAAGHRPCRECRREDHDRFKKLWLEGNKGLVSGANPSIDEIDRILHKQRVESRSRRQITFRSEIAELPNGTVITLESKAYLVWDDALLEWSPGGYINPIQRPTTGMVTVLTPRSTVNTFRAGYVPQVKC